MKVPNIKRFLGTAILSLPFGLLAIDTDGDGLGDSVETNTGVYVSPTNTGTDPDGDGQSNDNERIWGLKPTNALSRDPVTSVSGLKSGTFRHTRRTPSLTGYNYTVWTSTNLATWTQDSGAVQTPGVPVAEVETVIVNLSPALLTGPRLFVRMRAVQ